MPRKATKQTASKVSKKLRSTRSSSKNLALDNTPAKHEEHLKELVAVRGDKADTLTPSPAVTPTPSTKTRILRPRTRKSTSSSSSSTRSYSPPLLSSPASSSSTRSKSSNNENAIAGPRTQFISRTINAGSSSSPSFVRYRGKRVEDDHGFATVIVFEQVSGNVDDNDANAKPDTAATPTPSLKDGEKAEGGSAEDKDEDKAKPNPKKEQERLRAWLRKGQDLLSSNTLPSNLLSSNPGGIYHNSFPNPFLSPPFPRPQPQQIFGFHPSGAPLHKFRPPTDWERLLAAGPRLFPRSNGGSSSAVEELLGARGRDRNGEQGVFFITLGVGDGESGKGGGASWMRVLVGRG